MSSKIVQRLNGNSTDALAPSPYETEYSRQYRDKSMYTPHSKYMHSTQHEEDQLMQYLRPNLKIQDTEPEWQEKLVNELTSPEETLDHLKERLRSKSTSPVNRRVEFEEKPSKIIKSMGKQIKNEGVQININPTPKVPPSTPTRIKQSNNNNHYHHYHHHHHHSPSPAAAVPPCPSTSMNNDNNNGVELKGVNFHTGHSLYNDTFVRPPADAYNQINKTQRAWDDHIPFEYGNGYKDITTEYIDNISKTGLMLYNGKKMNDYKEIDKSNNNNNNNISIESQQSISFEEINNANNNESISESSSCSSSSRSSTPIKDIETSKQQQNPTIITTTTTTNDTINNNNKNGNSTSVTNKCSKLRSKTPSPTLKTNATDRKPSSQSKTTSIVNKMKSKTPTPTPATTNDGRITPKYKSIEIQTCDNMNDEKENNNCVCNRIIRPRSKSITTIKRTKTEGTQTQLIKEEEWKLNDKLNIKRKILKKREENEGVIKRVGGGYSGVKPKAMTKSKSFHSSFFPSKLPNYSCWQRYNTIEKHECNCKKPDIPHCNEAKKPTEYNRNLKTTVDKLLKMKIDKYSKRADNDYKSEYRSSYSDPIERERKCKVEAKLKVDKSF